MCMRVHAGALVIQGNIDPATAGLALMYALDLTRFLKHGTNMASKSEADFNSVERMVQVGVCGVCEGVGGAQGRALHAARDGGSQFRVSEWVGLRLYHA